MGNEAERVTDGRYPRGIAGNVASALERHQGRGLLIVLVVGFLVRLPFAALLPASSDLRAIVGWAQGIAQQGLVETTNSADVTVYPPLSMLLAGAAGIVSSAAAGALGSGEALVILLVKLPAIVADIGIAWLVVRMLHGRSIHFRLGVAALLLFNPALWYLSAVWGQTESVYAFFAVAAVSYASRNAVGRAWLMYGLAVAVKIQPVVLAPLMMLASLQVERPRRLITGLTIAATLLVVLMLPWVIGNGLVTYLDKLWGVTERLDDSATNLWYLLALGDTSKLADANSFPIGLPISAGDFGYALLATVVLTVCAGLWWRRSAVGLALPATLLSMAPFMLMPGMRERYLVLALPFALLLAARWERVPVVRGAWLAFIALTFALTVNLLVVVSPLKALWNSSYLELTGPLGPTVQVVTIAAAALNVIVFAWLLVCLIRIAIWDWRTEGELTPRST